MSQETIRFAQIERERLLVLRSLYQRGEYWKALYAQPAIISATGRGKCCICGREGNLYRFTYPRAGISTPRFCKSCMSRVIRSLFKQLRGGVL